MMKDLSSLQSPKEFKDFMEIINKQIESRKDYKVAAASVGDDSQN